MDKNNVYCVGCKIAEYHKRGIKDFGEDTVWQIAYMTEDGKFVTTVGSAILPDYAVPFDQFDTADIAANKQKSILYRK